MAHVVQEKREYQRILPSDKSINILESKGFEWVFSSNVSAAAVRGKDLIIRFHNSSIYSYAGQGKNFERLMAAASKGKWVWRFLRRPNVPFTKIGSLPLPEDTLETDEEVVQPKRPTHKVESIVPVDFIETGELPQILITPIEQTQSIMGMFGTGGALSTMAMLSTVNAIGIIAANIVADIIKGT